MNLQDVRIAAQFDAFYDANKLRNVDEKISFLKKEMGVFISWSEDGSTPEEELASLQQYALHCWDRVSHSEKRSCRGGKGVKDRHGDRPMTYRRACMTFGNGDIGRGRKNLFALAARMEEAREKHPTFAEGEYQAVGFIGFEFRELEFAIEHESAQRQLDEALDVACTAMRFVNGEHIT